jgi:hypothetical protein
MLRDYSIKRCCSTNGSTGECREEIMANLPFSKNKVIRHIALLRLAEEPEPENIFKQ